MGYGQLWGHPVQVCLLYFFPSGLGDGENTNFKLEMTTR